MAYIQLILSPHVVHADTVKLWPVDVLIGVTLLLIMDAYAVVFMGI